MKIIKKIGDFIANLWNAYSEFIHSIFPNELGDFAEYIIAIVVAVIVVKIVSSIAFRTKSNG